MLNTVLATFSEGAPPIAPSSYESIASSTPTTSTLTFSSIPATYKHLQLRIFATTASTANATIWPNNDSNPNSIAGHEIKGNGTAASAYGFDFGNSFIYFGSQNDQISMDATYPFVSVVDIIDYASTSKYKTFRHFSGQDRNGAAGKTGGVILSSYLWLSTSAITSLVINTSTGANFSSGSTFALYGIKG